MEDLVHIILGNFESSEHFHTWNVNLLEVYEKILKLPDEEKTLAKIIDLLYSNYGKKKSSSFQIWGDKTPANTLRLDWIDLLYEDVRYIHIIRDGRDVVSSYLNMGRYKKIESACERWNKSIKKARNFGQEKDDRYYHEIKYEEFVKNPENTIKNLCDFLQINYEKAMIYHHQNVEDLKDVNKFDHYKNVKKPISDKYIGKWKDNLTEKQKVKAHKLMKYYLKTLNYI